MRDYYRIYLQKEAEGSDVKDTIGDFGMYCMDNPFKMQEDVKEPTKRSWYDQHGDDEYIPDEGMYVAAYEKDVKFGFHGKAYGANEKLKSFLGYLRGGMMKMYCEYNRIGRQHIRLKGVKQTLYRSENTDEDLLVLTVTLKYNDPETDIKPYKDADGKITELRQ